MVESDQSSKRIAVQEVEHSVLHPMDEDTPIQIHRKTLIVVAVSDAIMPP